MTGSAIEPSLGPENDPWTALRAHTPARIALGRAGTSLPTAEVLRFAAAHAQARDAVHLPLDAAGLAAELGAGGRDVPQVRSRAASRAEYLARPDLGRRLDDRAAALLEPLVPIGDAARASPRLCVVVADGLSAIAARRHAVPVIEALEAALATGPGGRIEMAPVVVASQARVALGDEIGALAGAAAVLVLVGERPGLSSPDSLGAYLTWAPRIGRVDSERNCVSNIRPDGLAPAAAAARIAWLVREAWRRRVTGIALKDDSEVATLAADAGSGQLA